MEGRGGEGRGGGWREGRGVEGRVDIATSITMCKCVQCVHGFWRETEEKNDTV